MLFGNLGNAAVFTHFGGFSDPAFFACQALLHTRIQPLGQLLHLRTGQAGLTPLGQPLARFIQPLDAQQCINIADPEATIAQLCHQCRMKQRQRLLGVAQLNGNHPQIMVGVRMIGQPLQDHLVEHFGLAKPTGLMVMDGGFERRIQINFLIGQRQCVGLGHDNLAKGLAQKVSAV